MAPIRLDKIRNWSQKPSLYSRTDNALWSDEHISAQMLHAHLDPDWDAASRRHAFIDRSVEWLHESILPTQASVLDLGCGPGLYAKRLAERGHQVTGVDISSRSIAYAKEQAQGAMNPPTYLEANYLQMAFHEQFDAALLIYCDFGALSDDERTILAKRVAAALKPGGIWVLDVFRVGFRDPRDSNKAWDSADYGFWAPQPHLHLSETFHYPESDVFADQTLVLHEDGTIKEFRIWERLFTEETLQPFFRQAGLTVKAWYGDVAGQPICNCRDTMAVVVQKPV